jgi:hypothetical protein
MKFIRFELNASGGPLSFFFLLPLVVALPPFNALHKHKN